MLRQAQMLAPPRNPIRQNLSKLSRLHTYRRRPPLDQSVCQQGLETILIVPTESDNGTYYGNEYLQLYRKLDVSSNDRFAFWEPGASHGTVATSL